MSLGTVLALFRSDDGLADGPKPGTNEKRHVVVEDCILNIFID